MQKFALYYCRLLFNLEEKCAIFVEVEICKLIILSDPMSYQFINPEYLDSVSAGDTGIVKELVDMFRSQIQETQDEMRMLLNKKDYNSLGLLAHKAKSSVLIMGMTDLGSLLKTFELQAREGVESHRYESYINQFTHETSEAVKELEDLVNKRLIKNE